jgi:hypothetical protein
MSHPIRRSIPVPQWPSYKGTSHYVGTAARSGSGWLSIPVMSTRTPSMSRTGPETLVKLPLSSCSQYRDNALRSRATRRCVLALFVPAAH